MRRATVVLPVPGLPVKLMCSGGESAPMPRFRRALSTSSSGGDLADARLHGLQPDEIAIEPRQHVADRGLIVERAEVDGIGDVGFLDRLRLGHGPRSLSQFVIPGAP